MIWALDHPQMYNMYKGEVPGWFFFFQPNLWKQEQVTSTFVPAVEVIILYHLFALIKVVDELIMQAFISSICSFVNKIHKKGRKDSTIEIQKSWIAS